VKLSDTAWRSILFSTDPVYENMGREKPLIIPYKAATYNERLPKAAVGSRMFPQKHSDGKPFHLTTINGSGLTCDRSFVTDNDFTT
jgi:hypothetical protein